MAAGVGAWGEPWVSGRVLLMLGLTVEGGMNKQYFYLSTYLSICLYIYIYIYVFVLSLSLSLFLSLYIYIYICFVLGGFGFGMKVGGES